MKTRSLLIVFLLISATCFGKHIYKLSKSDLIYQFSDSNTLKAIYCSNNKGEKVWLDHIENLHLTLKLKGNKEVLLMLNSIIYKDQKIGGIEFGNFQSKQIQFFNIDGIESLLVYYDKQVYIISKADLSQFSNATKTLDRLYCYNEKGDKVWLNYIKSSQLILRPKNNDGKAFILNTIKYKNDTLVGIEFSTLWQTKQIRYSNIKNIDSFIIETKGDLFPQEQEVPYFDLDSCRNIVRLKNDSLKQLYSSGTEWIIKMVAKDQSKANKVLSITTNACYIINFKDNNHIENGVIEKITHDSIYILSSFNTQMAAAAKKEYKIYQYSISDISELILPRSGGYTTRKVSVEDYDITVENVERSTLGCPCWYKVYPSRGEVKFCRYLLVDNGFVGITEQNGHSVWANG